MILASGITKRSYTATSLYSATTYSFKVKARNSVVAPSFHEKVIEFAVRADIVSYKYLGASGIVSIIA